MENCSRIVGEEILGTKITFEELDYLEGTRMIVLNRSAQYCRNHVLQKVLPRRRGETGKRPGITGKGPIEAQRGNQEQLSGQK